MSVDTWKRSVFAAAGNSTLHLYCGKVVADIDSHVCPVTVSELRLWFAEALRLLSDAKKFTYFTNRGLPTIEEVRTLIDSVKQIDGVTLTLIELVTFREPKGISGLTFVVAK